MSRALQLAALAGMIIILCVLYLYRKGRLKEGQTLLWLLTSGVIILLSMWTDLLLAVNSVVGAGNISDVVLAAFIAFLILICIYYSVKISELAEQIKKLAQEMALVGVQAEKSSVKEEDSAE